MTNTLEYLRASRATLPAQLGRATMAQVLEASDAISCITTVCRHLWHASHVKGVPAMHETTFAKVGLSMSLAEMSRTLNLWRKWVKDFDTVPTLVTVEHFMFALRAELNA